MEFSVCCIVNALLYIQVKENLSGEDIYATTSVFLIQIMSCFKIIFEYLIHVTTVTLFKRSILMKVKMSMRLTFVCNSVNGIFFFNQSFKLQTRQSVSCSSLTEVQREFLA